ncbi:unnamed protein product [Phaeothamnion confervicola]
MNGIVAEVCARRCVHPKNFFGAAKAAPVVNARREAIERLNKAGLGPQKIAHETGLHVQTIYYWLNPKRRETLIARRMERYNLRRIGGPRQTPRQRQEIIDAYLENPAKGTALACSRGLSPLYAYKLTRALGLIARKDER